MSKPSDSQHTDPQYQQKIEELVAVAKEQGFITYEEINDILPMTFDTAEEIDQVLIFLSGMDIQIYNQAEIEKQKERKKEAKELELLPKRSDAAADDPVRMYLKEMGSVPLLTREEEVEISKRIEKAQMQIERIIMRFRYSERETCSIIRYLISGKERFDKIVAEKEVEDRAKFMQLLPKLEELLSKEDAFLEPQLLKMKEVENNKAERIKVLEAIEKSVTSWVDHWMFDSNVAGIPRNLVCIPNLPTKFDTFVQVEIFWSPTTNLFKNISANCYPTFPKRSCRTTLIYISCS